MTAPVLPPSEQPTAVLVDAGEPERRYPRFKTGDRVRIERDETRYPSKGTWPQFRSRTGTVVSLNLGEYGVSFGRVRRRPDGSLIGDDVTTWFQPYELRPAE